MKTGFRHMAKRILHAGLPLPGLLRGPIRGMYNAGVCMVEGLILVRKLIWVEPVLRSVCRRVGTGLRAERLPYIRGKGNLEIGSRVNLSGRSSFYFMRGMDAAPKIAIGDDAFVGNACTFSAASSIEIGNHALVSACVRVHDNDGHPADAERRRAGEPITPAEVAPVVIGENAWIGAEAIVLKGVTIGENAVIGAGAVVTRDVPANSVVAGNPAAIVRR
jgi:acetyltransferase-like isoleucine patch superfamily enzyme